MKRKGRREEEKDPVGDLDPLEENKCPECGGTNLRGDYGRGEIYCADCGVVISDSLVDPGPEWRAFDSEQRQRRSRVGAPLTLTIHDKGLSTVIDWKNKDSFGRSVSPEVAEQYSRLRKWQKKIRVSSANERNLATALTELERISSLLNIPRNVKEDAAMIYRKAVEKNLIRGRSIESVVAAALYAACRRCRVPKTLDEIADVADLDSKDVGRTYRFLIRELGLKIMPANPIDYIPRFANELGLSGEVQAKAIEIVKKAMERDLTSGKGPTGIAAAALYIASVLLGERQTQREIAEVAGVTEVTIRNRYKELAEKLDLNITL